MKRSVVIYCPDRHIVYDGRTPDEIGVGGGITARVRMARALARRGHEVHMVVNCPQAAEFDGVHYWPLDGRGPTEGDVLVANTSGGALDLTPAVGLAPGFALRLVWVHGTQPPGGLDRLAYDALYAVSNYVALIAIQEWGFPPSRVLVCYNGYEEAHFSEAAKANPARDPFRLVYFSHPSKGLDAARGVLRRLRAADHRYELHVYGDERLWGQAETTPEPEDGLTYHGLVGQRDLAAELLRAGFSMNLQSRPEPFGLTVVEAVRAGCIVLVSPVGALPEIVLDRVNGFVIRGDPASEVVQDQVAGQILDMAPDSRTMERMRRNAQAIPWSSDMMAEVWEQHWDWALAGRRMQPNLATACSTCGREALRLADGEHCLSCSRYAPSVWTEGAAAESRKPTDVHR